MLPERVDVAIAGAGSAGAALALFAARRGLSVLCLERGALDGAGARWINGIPRASFARAGLDAPVAPELRVDDRDTFHLVAGWGEARIRMREHGVIDVDMRHLTGRLQRAAAEAGALLAPNTAVHGVDDERLHTSAGTVRAEVIVDASGEAGARLLDQPPTPRRDLCSAAQHVHRVADTERAEAFFREHGAVPGETLCFSAIAGGYSILNVKMHHGMVDVLTGTIPADGHLGAGKLLDGFVAEHSWIGERCFGGRRVIPLGRPRDVLARGRIALLGDAARQVFSAHGSGVGGGLVAARMLADAVARHGAKGPEAYAVAWQREHGGTFASFDLFRRFSQQLDVAGVAELIDLGLVDESLARAGLGQALPRIELASLPARLRAARAGRRWLPQLLPLLGRIGGLLAHYRRFPQPPARWPGWSQRAARLAGE